MTDSPMVSCLMVTLPSPGRLDFLKRSVGAYCAQTLTRRELVIVLDQGPAASQAAIVDFIATLGRDDIRVVPAAGPLSLGALRNRSRAEARGDVHCQWDDDDLHHPRRLERQYADLSASGAEAVCLQEVLLAFTASSELYWTNWRATEPTVMPATLMCLASSSVRYPETGPESRRGEDTAAIVQLLKANALHAIVGEPQYYAYVCHGANTWQGDFHTMLADRLGLSQGLLRRRETWFRDKVSDLDLNFSGAAVRVRGPNGVAFTIDPRPKDQTAP